MSTLRARLPAQLNSTKVAADGACAEGEFVDAFGHDVGDVVGTFEHAADEEGAGVTGYTTVPGPTC